MKKLMKHKYLIFVAITIIALLYFVIEAINLNPLYPEGAFFWCALVTAYIAGWVMIKFGQLIPKFSVDQATGRVLVTPGEPISKKIKVALFLPWIYFVVMIIISSPIVNWKAYRDQLGEPEVKTFSTDIQVLDTNQIPIVDRDLALNLADKKLGERASLGSQVVLGEPTIQMNNNELVWVVPLHHSGIFQWINNMEGTPGYIVVSATNVNDVDYVEGFPIKYHYNSYLHLDLERYLRLTVAPFTGITDYSFELDDSGQPYWVVTTYKNQAGFALGEATGVITLNASTGETGIYDMASIPEWVDRVQPEQFIVNQINNKGQYVHGIFNFSDKDKYKPSHGEAIVYNDGRCYLFTGLTSVGQDESAIGFMMVDMVTKEPILYQMNGATESSAQSSAQGKVQHLEYYASFPIILNINGNPTYFMTLKDREGLIKQYAFVSVSSYSSVGTGETIDAALADYKRIIQDDGISSPDLDTSSIEKTITANILRIADEFNGSETVYKLILEGYEDKIFIVPSRISDELALTLDSESATISYYDIEGPILDVFAFDNNHFGDGANKPLVIEEEVIVPETSPEPTVSPQEEITEDTVSQ